MNVPVTSILDLEDPSRRRFLRKTALGLAALSASRLLFSRLAFASTSSNPATPLHFLSSRQYHVLAAIGDRMIPSSPDLPGATQLNLAASLDAYLAGIDRPVAEQLAQLLDLFDVSPFVFDFKLQRFTALGPSEQDSVLRSWATSRFEFRRTAFQALKRLSMAAYYSQEATWKAIGYDGPLV